MAINKVVYGNQVLIDITDSTVNPNTLLAGYKGYGADGNPVVGALQLSYHITLKQAQYDALSESEKMADENWFYIDDIDLVGAQLDDSAISPAKVWSSQKTNNEIQDVQDQVDINTTDIGTLNSALTSLSTGLSQVFMSGNFKYVGNPYITDVDVWMNGLVDAAGGNDVSVSANNHRSVTNPAGAGNNQFIFGWLNATKTYGWVVVFTFSGLKYGKRNGASTFSWSTL